MGRLRPVVAAVVVALATSSTLACSGGSDEVRSLTRDEIEQRSGLDLPASLEGFRATRTGDGELQFTATIAAADADDLTGEAALALESGRRVITHSSPLWELNPAGEITGGVSTFEEVRRTVEVVTDGSERAILRVVLNGL